MDFKLSPDEREYLRSLAKKQLEYSQLPEMKQRRKEWYAHNECKGEKPLIVIEWGTFFDDLYQCRCSTEFGRMIETRFAISLVRHELVGDDFVVPEVFRYGKSITVREFGLDIPVSHAIDTKGRNIGFHWDHPIKNIEKDFDRLKPFEFSHDAAEDAFMDEAIKDLIGDILPVCAHNDQNWFYMPTAKAVQLMGLEQLMMSMYDEPEQVHRLMRYLTDNCHRFIDWQEQNGLMTMNNVDQSAGSGSFGYTDELKAPADGHVRPENLWFNTNSQESSSISPAMYAEFVYPYTAELAQRFGLVYYGCCEPVDPIWDACLKNLPHLRKVSISPWCNEEAMGENLRGKKIIYARKPSPTFLGVDPVFNEAGYREHIKKTLRAAKGCEVEFSYRDVYTILGDTERPRRAVRILRDLIESEWGK